MPVFLERFVLPVLATAVITVIWLNPFKWDWQQRISLFVGVVFLAYFFGYTSYRSTRIAASPLNTGDAITSAPNSPAVTGDRNNIQYSQPSPPPEGKPEPEKKE
jgi:hypothetical protein